MKLKDLFIDLETYSSVSLAKSGVYRYSESPDFTVLLFGFSRDGGPVEVVDLARGEALPDDVLSALTDPGVRKHAHNAMFERVCLSRWLGLPTGQYLDPDSWFCTMVWCAELGLPLSLEGVGAVLGLEKQKLSAGKELIRLFCAPKVERDGSVRRVLPEEHPEKWELFIEYNRRDVETEMEIEKRISRFPVPASEWSHYHLDQRINDAGIMIDRTLAGQAILCDEQFKRTHMELAKEITGLDNPGSAVQMKEWLAGQGCETDTLGKLRVLELLQEADGDVREVLTLRQELSKSSVSKYKAMEQCVCADGRARGLIQFYGTHTGRYAGRLIQVQNLPQNHLEDLDLARSLVRDGKFDMLELLYDSVPVVLSELVRTAFVPKPGCSFYVADFSAVEARCLAFLAHEEWRNQVFAEGKDIYSSSAAKMFGVPVVKNGINGHLRQKGKISELALGYGGSVGALVNMGAVRMGLKEDELKPLVAAWRNANPNITRFWWAIDEAVKRCVRDKARTAVGDFVFTYESGLMFAELPSGRRIAYVKPRMSENRYGGVSTSYEGTGGQKKWTRIESYGPKYVENLIQAYARDLLAEAMQRLTAHGYTITMSVHDEVVVEAPEGSDLQEICDIMGETPPWAEGLLLRADGYVCGYYKKE